MGPMLTVTVALADPPWPSLMAYWITTAPLTLFAGLKVRVPFGFTVTVPSAGSTDADVTVSASPSTSLSLASTAMVVGAFIGVDARSFCATGASLTGAMLMVTCEVLAAPPVETV